MPECFYSVFIDACTSIYEETYCAATLNVINFNITTILIHANKFQSTFNNYPFRFFSFVTRLWSFCIVCLREQSPSPLSNERGPFGVFHLGSFPSVPCSLRLISGVCFCLSRFCPHHPLTRSLQWLNPYINDLKCLIMIYWEQQRRNRTRRVTRYSTTLHMVFVEVTV